MSDRGGRMLESARLGKCKVRRSAVLFDIMNRDQVSFLCK